MDSVKKETASDIHPPGVGPCCSAQPGLVPYIDCQKGEVVIPQEILKDSVGAWELRGGKIVFIIYFGKVKPE